MRWAVLMFPLLACSAQGPGDAISLLRKVEEAARSAKSWAIEGHRVDLLQIRVSRRGNVPEPAEPAIDKARRALPAGDFKLTWHAPDRVRYESAETNPGRALVVCDGTAVWTYFPSANQYLKEAPARDASSSVAEGTTPDKCDFVVGDWQNLLQGVASATFAGHETVEFEGGPRDCDTVRATYAAGAAWRSGLTSRELCIDPDRLLILRETFQMDYSGSGRPNELQETETRTYSSIRRDLELDPSLFIFTPPEGRTAADKQEGPPYRVGNGVTPPVLIARTDPEYPREAVRAGVEGTVALYVEIGPDGRAHNARVVRPFDPELDKRAIECVAQWKFRPGEKDGRPVTVAATIEVNFRLVRK